MDCADEMAGFDEQKKMVLFSVSLGLSASSFYDLDSDEPYSGGASELGVNRCLPWPKTAAALECLCQVLVFTACFHIRISSCGSFIGSCRHPCGGHVQPADHVGHPAVRGHRCGKRTASA